MPCLYRNCALRRRPSTSPLRGYAQDERLFCSRFFLPGHPERSVSEVEGYWSYAPSQRRRGTTPIVSQCRVFRVSWRFCSLSLRGSGKTKTGSSSGPHRFYDNELTASVHALG